MEKFREELGSEINLLRDSILHITQEIESPALIDPESSYDEVMQSLEKIEKSIEKLKGRAGVFQDYEKRFDFPVDDFFDIDTAEFNLYHLNLLWESFENWDAWSQNAFSIDFNSLSVDDCKTTVNKFLETLSELNAKDEPNEILTILGTKVNSFKSKIPCIAYLRSPMLKQRHWSKIEEIAGDDISHGVTLQFIADRGVFEKEDEIKKVFEKAKAEGKLEDLLNHLEAKWAECSFKTVNEMGCNVIATFAPVWIMIEESIEIIKIIGNSIHSATLRPKIMDWSEKLDMMETTLERLDIVQGFWLDLEPVATTNDVKWHQKDLYNSYMEISDSFKGVLATVTQEPNMISALTNQYVSETLDDLDDKFIDFDKNMESLLSPKRAMCPRLYFISDKEMITLYRVATYDIKKIEPYVRKMFKNVHELVLAEEQEEDEYKVVRRYNPLLSGFKSAEGEYVKFHRIFKARGQIDEWVKFLDHFMKTTLMFLCRELKAKSRLKRRSFEEVLDDHKYPYQVTAIIAHYLWCEELVSFSKRGISQVIMDVHNMKKRLAKKMTELNETIRESSGILRQRSIAKLQHMMYWIEYLDNWEEDRQEEIIRYVWDDESNQVQIQIDNDTFRYGYEYVGLNPIFQPVVIGGNSSLAFKMALKYNLIIDASEMHTLHKLSKVFGTNMKTILCNNPNMTLKTQQHLVGSSMSGSWINLKNLDSVDQVDLTKIFQIMQRLRNARIFGSKTFQYNNKEIKQLPTCQMIMSNEHIMGNLKFFGRPVNFEEQNEISKLKYALLQRGTGSMELLDILINIINDCTEVGIHGVFNRIMKIVYSTDSLTNVDIVSSFIRISDFETNTNLSCLLKICKAYVQDLRIPSFSEDSFDYADDDLLTPCIQIYNAYKNHRFIAVMGEEQGVGKTFDITRVLEHKEKKGKKNIRIYPLSYGAKYLVPDTNHYSVSKILGSFLKDIGEEGGTIHFCGALDSEWKSCLETITQDSPYMLLENGEYATLPENLNFIFEITDLDEELPENIAEQAVLISIPNQKIEISIKLFQSWLGELTLLRNEEKAKEIIHSHMEKFHVLFCKSLEILQRNFASKLKPRFISATVSLLKFFNGLLENLKDTCNESLVLRSYLFSLTWAFSGYINQTERMRFVDILRDEVESSGYFNIQVDWDFINGKFNPDGSITPWKSSESDRLFVSVESQEIASYLILQNILQNRHCLIIGPTGSGKSTILKRVVEQNYKIIFKDQIEFYMTASTTASEVEELIVNALKRRIKPYKILLVLYNADCNNINHLELARSLCENRNVYLSFQKRWVSFSDLIVCIESSSTINKDSPQLLEALVSKSAVISLQENFEELEKIYREQLNVFLEEELMISQDYLGNKVSKLIVNIYKDARKVSSLFSRHNIMRCFRGILKAHPDRVVSEDTLLQLVHLELTAEFQDCLVHEHLKKAYIDIHEGHFYRIFGVTKEKLAYYNTKYILMFKIDEEEDSDNEEQAESTEMHFVEEDQLNEILDEAYPKIRGKLNLSSYDEKIVFSAEYKEYFINLLRALDSDQDIIIIGEPGVGKRSMARFATLFMGLELITMDDDDNDWKEIFRNALLDASKDDADMIIVVGPDYVDNKEVLSTISDIRAYGFSWNLIDDYERKDLLYADHEDPFMSLFSKAKFEEMDNSLKKKVNHNLNFVFCLEDQNGIEEMVRNYPFIMRNCVIIYFSIWSDTTMASIAEDRLKDLDSKVNLEMETITKCCSSLHQFCRETYNSTTSSQFLEFVALFPEMYLDMITKLQKNRESLQIGIDQAIKAQTHIDRFNTEITSKEPEIKKLVLEAEQLNKRLAQERQNLEKASQTFRKKEAKARAKSEITQELAAETHQNLEQALPHLESSNEAINSIDKGEIAEMRGFKQVPELVLNVLEAVCILLGVKPDWQTAKNLLAEPSLIQQLIDYDKDNVSDAVLKRIRRYIENPKFVPDEVAKVSRACCSLCMWVRAIDYYAKIFKTIEPKRIKLLQAESELAEAMTSLRKETDRVTHIETTITNIQSSHAEKLKRKASLESHILDLQSNQERAEQLAYALEEELKKWKIQLNHLDSRLSCLTGDCLIGGMIIAYGGQFEFKEREHAIMAWKEICMRYRIPVSNLSILDIFEPILNIQYLRADTLPAFDFYQENCLIVQKSKKWILFEDPDNLAKTWIHQAELSNIVEVDMHDPQLIKRLKLSLNKGHIFLIDNFSKEYPPEIEKLIEYEIYEKLRVFVGLIGIPEKKKELKVLIGKNEITVNPKFKLYLRSESVENRKSLQEYLKIVNFKMSVQLFKSHVHKALIREDNEALEVKRLELRSNQLKRKDKLEEEKDIILKLLYNAQEALLEDEDLIGNITDAKARVVIAMNSEREAKEASDELKSERIKYLALVNALTELYEITEEFQKIDPIYYFPTSSYIEIMKQAWEKVQPSSCTVEERVKKSLPFILENVCTLVTEGLHTSHRFIFLLLFVVKVVHCQESNEEKRKLSKIMQSFTNLSLDVYDSTHETVEVDDEQFKALPSVRLGIFLRALRIRYNKNQSLFSAFTTFIESELRRAKVTINIDTLCKRLKIIKDTSKPLLIVEHGLLDTWGMIAKLVSNKEVKKPRLLVMGKHLEFTEIQRTVEDCKASKTLLIMQGIHNQINELVKLKIPTTDNDFMIYATIPKVFL